MYHADNPYLPLPSPIAAAVELEAFREHRATLLTAISEPEILPFANALYSEGVIGEFDLEEAGMNACTPTVRKNQLLDAIKAKITSAPWKFKAVLDILRSNSFCLCEVADGIQLSYDRKEVCTS